MRRVLVLALLVVGCRHHRKVAPTPVGTVLVDVSTPAVDSGKVPIGAPAEAFHHTAMKVGVFSPAVYNGDGAGFSVTYDQAKTEAVAGRAATAFANVKIAVTSNKDWAMSGSCATGSATSDRSTMFVTIPCTVNMRNGKEEVTLTIRIGGKQVFDAFAQGDWEASIEGG